MKGARVRKGAVAAAAMLAMFAALAPAGSSASGAGICPAYAWDPSGYDKLP